MGGVYLKSIVRFIIAATAFFIIWYVVNYYTYEFSHDGDMAYELNPILSPDGRYEANVYFDNYGGAVGGTNLIVKVKDVEEGEEKTIYYGDGKATWLVQWIDKDVLHVKNESEMQNLSSKLIVGEEIYDQSGDACNMYKVRKLYRCKQMEN